MAYQTIYDRINEARTGATNAINDPVIKSKMAVYNYTEEVIGGGIVLADEAGALAEKFQMEFAEQKRATAALEKAWKTADEVYIKSLKAARIVFRNDPAAIEGLQLEGDRSHDFDVYLGQANAFYNNFLANADWLAEGARLGFTAEKLTAEKVLVDAMSAANISQESEKAESQQARQLRDEKDAELRAWLRDFKDVAAIALGDDNQLLEKLGITVR